MSLSNENLVFVHASPEDASKFHLYQAALHGENSIYFSSEKESASLSTQRVKNFIVDSLKSPSSALFILKDMQTREIFAHVHIQVGTTERSHHVAEVYIGVLKQFQGVGVGKKLMEIVDFWARKENIERVQLSVFDINEKAISFYKKIGFEEEGRLKNSVKFGENSYCDEILMAKFVEPLNLELTAEAIKELNEADRPQAQKLN